MPKFNLPGDFPRAPMVPSNRGARAPMVPSNRGGQGAQPRPRARGPVVVTALIEKNEKKIPEYLIKIFNFDHFFGY